MNLLPTYSLVIPIFNESENLQSLYNRVCKVMESLQDTFEVILVDDGSSDDSVNIIQKLRQNDARVCYVFLARNFGHQIAVTAGLKFAQGKAIIVLDADLQDPPELIPDLVSVWKQGYQVVYAKRISRQQEPWLKRFLAYCYYRFLGSLVDVEIPPDTGEFCLMDRKVLQVLNAMPERNRYLRGLRAWVGFRQTEVSYHREPRYAGQPKYNLLKSWLLAVDGIISLSRVPLKLSTYLGLLAAILALIMVGLVIYWRLAYIDSPLISYALISASIFFLSSVQLICMGILGEYIGRIYEEVKGRPLFTIRDIAGINLSQHNHDLLNPLNKES